MSLKLTPYKEENRELFIKNLQEAFKQIHSELLGTTETPIAREFIEKDLDNPESKAFHIMRDNEIIGGTVITARPSEKNTVDLLYINVGTSGKGIGQKVWTLIEEEFPKTKVWELYTPCFNEKNIHFYVNKCGFKIVEFFNEYHKNDHYPIDNLNFFRFEKEMIGTHK